MLAILNSDKIVLSEDDTRTALNVIKWRFRLGAMGETVLLVGSKRKVLAEDTLTRLNLHLAWFVKFTLEAVKEVLKNAETASSEM